MACFFASLSAISFTSIPVWPGIYRIVIHLPVCNQVLPASLNCFKIPWLKTLGICPALHATLRLSKQLWIPGATRAMGLLKASSRPLSKATGSASYTSCVSPKGVPHLLYQLSTQLMTQPAPNPVGVPVWSVSCDSSVYITMSSGFNVLGQVLNCAVAFSLSPVPPVESKHFLDPPNRCFSHGSVSNRGSEYSTSAGHF